MFCHGVRQTPARFVMQCHVLYASGSYPADISGIGLHCGRSVPGIPSGCPGLASSAWVPPFSAVSFPRPRRRRPVQRNPSPRVSRLIAPARVQAQGEVAALAPPAGAALAGRRKRRQALMELHRLDKQPVAAAPVGRRSGPGAEAAASAAPGPPCRTPQAPATPADGVHGTVRAPPPSSAGSTAMPDTPAGTAPAPPLTRYAAGNGAPACARRRAARSHPDASRAPGPPPAPGQGRPPAAVAPQPTHSAASRDTRAPNNTDRTSERRRAGGNCP